MEPEEVWKRKSVKLCVCMDINAEQGKVIGQFARLYFIMQQDPLKNQQGSLSTNTRNLANDKVNVQQPWYASRRSMHSERHSCKVVQISEKI